MMKSKTLIALMTTVLSTTSFAEIHTSLKNAGFSENHAPLSDLLNNEALSTEDLAYAFNNSENLQLIAMSEQEMQDTQGAWSMAGALSGVSLSGLNYASYLAGGGEFNATTFVTKLAGGAIIGGVGNGLSVAEYYMASRVVALEGVIEGIATNN